MCVLLAVLFSWPRQPEHARAAVAGAVADATDVVRTCQGCQFYARKTHLPAHALQTIPITWLFAVWGLDLVGPL